MTSCGRCSSGSRSPARSLSLRDLPARRGRRRSQPDPGGPRGRRRAPTWGCSSIATGAVRASPPRRSRWPAGSPSRSLALHRLQAGIQPTNLASQKAFIRNELRADRPCPGVPVRQRGLARSSAVPEARPMTRRPRPRAAIRLGRPLMDLPPWLTPLPDAAQQRALDTWAIEQHRIPGETLMERAGSALARVCADVRARGADRDRLRPRQQRRRRPRGRARARPAAGAR